MFKKEIRFELLSEVSSKKSNQVKENEIEEIMNEIKEITKCDRIERIDDSIACYDYWDCDDEALKFFIYYKNPSRRIYLHVCISDPEDIEAIADDFENDIEDLEFFEKKLKESGVFYY